MRRLCAPFKKSGILTFNFEIRMTLHIQTPYIESLALSQRTGKSVWLKMDALQPCGSFKLRGIGHACEIYAQKGAKRFVSSSSGNAGLAVAYSGRALGLAVTVVVPESSSQTARELLKQYGAEVIVHGPSWQEANALAQTLLGSQDAYIHPFDDPLLWTGHATMVDEMAANGPKPDVIILSVGGGGLLCGVVEGLDRNGWADVPVLAVETKGADSWSQAMAAGHLVSLDKITSIAGSLGSKQVAAQSLHIAKNHHLIAQVVTDAQAVSACLNLITDHRVVVEPACGAALAPVYDQSAALHNYDRIAVIVCGGVTASLAQLHSWDQQFST